MHAASEVYGLISWDSRLILSLCMEFWGICMALRGDIRKAQIESVGDTPGLCERPGHSTPQP